MKQSSGILLFKITHTDVYVLLAHPGGPFWKNKDLASWSIPKGEFETEDALSAAIREFEEETGTALKGDFIELKPVKQKSGKIVFAWAHEQDFDPISLNSNTFELEWPPKSGKLQNFPEIDRVEWFRIDEALQKIVSAQADFLLQLTDLIQKRNLRK